MTDFVIKREAQPRPTCHSCKLCHYQTKSAFSITQHRKRHRNLPQLFACAKPVPAYKCDTCSFQTHLVLNFNEHRCHLHKRVSDMRDMLQCNNCNFKTYSQLVLMKHVWSRCVNVRTEERLHVYSSKRKEYVKCHQFLMQIWHRSIEWLKCQQCSYMTRVAGDIGRHMTRVHKANSNVKWFECELCLYNVEQIFHLRQHVLKEHGEDVEGLNY